MQVVDTQRYQKPLILADTYSLLKLLYVNAKLCKVQETSNEDWSLEDINSEFQDIFEGLGCLPGDFHLDIEPEAMPVKDEPSRVPIPLKEKLKELVSLNITAKVTEPTDWISSRPMVIVMKINKIRICLDLKNLNQALRRPHYQMPTIHDILPNLANAKVFSVLARSIGFGKSN